MSRYSSIPRATVLGIEVQVSRLSVVALDMDHGLCVVYDDHILYDRDLVEETPKLKQPHASASSRVFSLSCLLLALDMLFDRASHSESFDFRTIKAISVTGTTAHAVVFTQRARTTLASLSPFLPLGMQIHSPEFYSADRLHNLCDEEATAISAAHFVTAILTGKCQSLSEPEMYSIPVNEDLMVQYTDDTRGRSEKSMLVSPWIRERYQVDPTCIVAAPIASSAAAYRSFLPETSDVGIGFGAEADEVLIDPSVTIRFPGFAEARRDMCTRIGFGRWSTASRLALATPPGGTIGLDDNLYCIPQLNNSKSLRVIRYQYGTPVSEFEDARAESRCLLEGQVLSFRSALESLGYVTGVSTRVFCWGRAVETRALSAALSEILAADVIASQADYDAGKLEDQYSVPAQPYRHLGHKRSVKMAQLQDTDVLDTRIRRATIGAAYWAYFVLKEQLACSFLDFNTTLRAGLDKDDRSNRGSTSSSDSSYHTCTSLDTDRRDDTSIDAIFAHCTKGLPPGYRGMLPKISTTVRDPTRGLVRLARSDVDMATFYGALLPEFNRLWGSDTC